MHLMESLPEIRELLLEDVQAAFDGDPAAQYVDEIVLSYPCIEAIATYRLAHMLYEINVPIIPRIMAERAHSRTGIDIHPGAKIGARFFIDHGTGVVIGETTVIGKNVKIYQGVTLGALSPFDKDGKPLKGEKRHPDIEDDVIIYANATILGGKTKIGKGAIIGGNTWITKSVPAGAFIYRTEK
jgi:serine O-acetyltransferase